MIFSTDETELTEKKVDHRGNKTNRGRGTGEAGEASASPDFRG